MYAVRQKNSSTCYYHQATLGARAMSSYSSPVDTSGHWHGNATSFSSERRQLLECITDPKVATCFVLNTFTKESELRATAAQERSVL